MLRFLIDVGLTLKVPHWFWRICFGVTVVFMVAVQIHLDFRPYQNVKEFCRCLHQIVKLSTETSKRHKLRN